jgi:hypothetical protein
MTLALLVNLARPSIKHTSEAGTVLFPNHSSAKMQQSSTILTRRTISSNQMAAGLRESVRSLGK